VQVALEPPALGVAGRDDPRARGAHLRELRPQLGLQAGVLDREPSGGADGLEQLAVLVQERVVLERGEALAAVLEDRDRAARVGLGRRAVDIDVAPSTQKSSRSVGSPSARASASRTRCGGGSSASSTNRRVIAPRRSRALSRPARKASGMIALDLSGF
jgi:hypothetical protein